MGQTLSLCASVSPDCTVAFVFGNEPPKQVNNFQSRFSANLPVNLTLCPVLDVISIDPSRCPLGIKYSFYDLYHIVKIIFVIYQYVYQQFYL